MRKVLFLTVLGIAAIGFMLAAPSVSQAQVGCGSGGYYSGGSYPGYGGSSYDRGFAPSYSGYGGYYDRGYAPSYSRRPVIDHPTSQHWTPDRGPHTHGHIHVPHRLHYHTRPY